MQYLGRSLYLQQVQRTIVVWSNLSPGQRNRQEKTERDKMTAKLRWSILESGGFRCRVCGHGASAENPLHVDHIVPVSLGGKTVPENLQILCSRCNLGKGASMPTQSALDFWEQMEK